MPYTHLPFSFLIKMDAQQKQLYDFEYKILDKIIQNIYNSSVPNTVDNIIKYLEEQRDLFKT